ncbi:MAG: hypothetical protein IJ049_03685, partial [Oscillospiraceae bacterium]|nr:hypothetical protein [Oscillospiraceae bacterium]
CPVDLTPERPGIPCMAKLLMSPVNGIITAIDEAGLDRLRRGGVTVALDFPVGHAVEAMENGTTRIGHVVTAAEQESQLDDILRRVYRCIYVDGSSLEELWNE